MVDATDTSTCDLLDALEHRLVAEFGLCSALASARALLGDDARAAAAEQVRLARADRSDAIARGATLEAIEAAGRREDAAEAVAAQLEVWRGRPRAAEALALEIFAGAAALGPAADPRWWPGRDALPREAPTPLYLRAPKLRIAGHFEPEVELLIHDRALGTLAMVQVLDAGEPATIREQVSRYVDRATYLRHLLLTDRDERGGRDRQIVSVELVLVHRTDLGDAHGDLLYEVGEILRDLALETNCLHAIGVNVLAADGPDFARSGLRRAFSWLLHDTRRWFVHLERRRLANGATRGFGRLRAIELDEYRLPGVRTLELAANTRLHLVHGHNGSGKSSLVEALELMLTGSIERLAGISDYERVVRNHWASGPARIVLHPSDPSRAPVGFELRGPERPPASLAPGSRAASFRLDQTLMDRLARASDVDRAAELLAAFFADEAEVRERWQEAVAAAEATLSRLPARIRTWLDGCRRERQDLHEVVVEQLAELARDRIGADLLDALLPLPRAQLEPLHAQIPALAELDARLADQGFIAVDDELLARAEAMFERLVADLDERVATVEAVVRTLERVGRWWQAGDDGGFASEAEYAAALDEWLELCALVELGAQQRRVFEIVAAARADGWDPRRFAQAGGASDLLHRIAEVEPAVIDELRRTLARLTERRDELARALRRRTEQDAGPQPVAATRVRLDAHEIAQLDRFGHWWAPQEAGPGLGQRIHAAISEHEPRSFARVDIGVHGWVTPIHAAAEAMLEPLRTLRQHRRRAKRVAAPAPERVGEGQAGEELELEFDDLSEQAEAAELSELPGPGAALDRLADAELELADELADADADADEWGPASSRELAQRAEPAPVRRAAPQAKSIAIPKPPGRAPATGPAPAPAAAPAAASAAPRPGPTRSAANEAMRSPLEPAPSAAPEAPIRQQAWELPTPRSSAPSLEVEPTPGPTLGHGFEPELGLAATIERLRGAHAVSVRAHEIGAEVQDSFVARLAAHDERALGLLDALNELMALFTPARWAYEDVLLRYEQDGEVSRLQFETGDVREAAPGERARADLRLNTAQLNAFTLALFLLCAPRVANPIGLLVLDDPLQNMDELTVTTLARGLAKLLRVLPDHWSLMMLFHGEGDLARFHDEVECGVYFLPWLSPTIRGRAITVECRSEDSRLGLEIQDVEELLAPRP